MHISEDRICIIPKRSGVFDRTRPTRAHTAPGLYARATWRGADNTPTCSAPFTNGSVEGERFAAPTTRTMWGQCRLRGIQTLPGRRSGADGEDHGSEDGIQPTRSSNKTRGWSMTISSRRGDTQVRDGAAAFRETSEDMTNKHDRAQCRRAVRALEGASIMD